MQHAFTYFPLIPGTKEPACKWRDVKRDQYQNVGNYGIALTADILVLDFDPRNYPVIDGPEGVAIRHDLFSAFFSRFSHLHTRIVKTPRGGYHAYFKKPEALKIAKKQPNYPGIDFLSEGFYVVGPGTSTIASDSSAAGTYELLGDDVIADFPMELLVELVEPTESTDKGTAHAVLTCEQEFIGVCQQYAPAIQGSGGDDHTFQLACIGRDLGLPVDVIYQHMRDIWNPTCQPPWTEHDLYAKAKNAFKYASNKQGSRTPEAIFGSFAEDRPAEVATTNVVSMQSFKTDSVMNSIRPATLQLDKKGAPTDCLANVVCILNSDPFWRDMFLYNEFSNDIELKRVPPWRPESALDELILQDLDVGNLQIWFSNQRLEIAETKLVTAIRSCAKRYHPVKEYLEPLQWDGVPRLDKILVDTVGAEDTPLNRQIGKNLLIGAVKRIYEPGCKLDTVVILEGVQGTQKSTWVEVLGGVWYSANELVRGDKDTFQNLRGRWFVELPEINSTFSKNDFNWLKGIITCAADVYRPSYERTSRKVKRQSCFVATINPSANAEYLKDEENRRYLPVKTGFINIDWLKANRDQYFAEALHRYRKGEQMWISDKTILAAARVEQEKRREKDPWLDVLRDWLNTQKDGIYPNEIYHALGYQGKDLQSHHRKRFYSVMTELGFEFVREHGSVAGKWVKAHLTWEDVI